MASEPLTERPLRPEERRVSAPSAAEAPASASTGGLQSELEEERRRAADLERRLARLERPTVILEC